MVRAATPFAVFLLLALALAPSFEQAGARVLVEGTSPVEEGYPSNPQLYCVVVYEDPGEQKCRVQGDVRRVEVARVRIVGVGASVYVSVIDDRGPLGLPEQRALFTCASSCLVPVTDGPHDDASWTMHVHASSPGRTYVQASLEAATRVDRFQV